MARTVIPFGPQHPVFPEPIQLKLECEDERVIGATPAIGYVHRGIEKACELNGFRKNVFLVERVCGICSFIHTLAFCQGIEEMMGIEAPLQDIVVGIVLVFAVTLDTIVRRRSAK